MGSGQAFFSVGTYNVRGPITVSRFLFLLQQYPSLPSVLGLTEFSIPKGSFLRQYQHLAWVTRQRWLLSSVSGQKAGVALLVDPAVVPGAQMPDPIEIFPGRVLAMRCRVHPSPSQPLTTIAVVYGSCIPSERIPLASALEPLLKDPCILLGDWNATTELAHSTTGSARSLVWPWLQTLERDGALVDLTRVGFSGDIRMTRCRGHPGASYLDRIYASASLFPTLSICDSQVGSVKGIEDQEHFSDHDFVHVAVAPWITAPPLHPHPCASWSRKHVRLYRRLMEPAAPVGLDATTLGGSELLAHYQMLAVKMKSAMEQVNSRYPPKAVVPQDKAPTWHEYVQQLVRLARRNPRIFFRRVKSYHLLQIPDPVVPLPSETLLSLLQSAQPWDPSALDSVPQQPQKMLGPLPSDAQMRRLAHVPRTKRGGPDGIPPYLIHQLPDSCFALLSVCVRRVVLGQIHLPDLFDASLFGLYKGKGDWALASNWRPLCLTTSIYRLVMKVSKEVLEPMVSGWLRPEQFGARKERSCAQATFSLLDGLQRALQLSGRGLLLLVDISNAFGSTPIALVIELLKRLGVPQELVSLCELNFQLTRVHTMDGGKWIRPTSGLKQGCPLSPLLFILLFNACLLTCQQTSEKRVAFMDDLALVFSSLNQLKKGAQDARLAMQRFGWLWNLRKTVLLSPGDMGALQVPFPSSLPTPASWLMMPSSLITTLDPLIPEQAGSVPHRVEEFTLTGVQQVTHLGHPVVASLKPADAYLAVLRLLETAVVHFHNQPIPFPQRVTLVNLLLAPRILYLTECIPPWPPGLQKISDLLCDFVQGVKGIPKALVTKTLFSKQGLGLSHVPTLIPVRVLDALNSYVEALHPSTQECPFSLGCHQSACKCLGASCRGSGVPVQRAVSQYMALPSGVVRCPLQVDGLQVFSLSTPIQWSPNTDCIYTDGSYCPDGGLAGCAVLLPQGQVYMTRPPGAQSIYKAELLAVLIACSVAGLGFQILCDSLGVIRAVTGTSRRVVLGRWVHRIRNLLAQKNLRLKHVRGHTGEAGNELVDRLAKRSCRLPTQHPQFPEQAWDVCFQGEKVQSPHKSWARALIPHHANIGIHPISWKPLKTDPHRWLRWLFGLVDSPGFASHYTFWQELVSATRCAICLTFHNRSVAGTVAFCMGSPLCTAWESAWGPWRDLVCQWRTLAQKRDRWMVGKVVVPSSLWDFLRNSLGNMLARNAVLHWQSKVILSLNAALPKSEVSHIQGDTRLNCWEMEGWFCWDEERKPPPLRRRKG